MDEMDATPGPEDEGSVHEAPTYEPPAVAERSSGRDPLVWTVSSPVICL